MFKKLRRKSIAKSLLRPIGLPDRSTMGSGEWAQYIGALGEDLAARYLRSKGGKVIYRNFRAEGGGEVDIVSRDGETLVFTEVKARTSDAFGRAALAVDAHKQKLIAKGAVAWLRMLRNDEVEYRFDVIEVYLKDDEAPRFEQLQHAFAMPKKKRPGDSWSPI